MPHPGTGGGGRVSENIDVVGSVLAAVGSAGGTVWVGAFNFEAHVVGRVGNAGGHGDDFHDAVIRCEGEGDRRLCGVRVDELGRLYGVLILGGLSASL